VYVTQFLNVHVWSDEAKNQSRGCSDLLGERPLDLFSIIITTITTTLTLTIITTTIIPFLGF
jgi:hypothetical protein